MPKFKEPLGPAPRYTIEKILKNQEKILGCLNNLKTIDQLATLMEQEQEKNSKRVSTLLTQVQELKLSKKKLEEETAIQKVEEEETTGLKKRVKLPVALLTLLLTLATILGGAGTALLLN